MRRLLGDTRAVWVAVLGFYALTCLISPAMLHLSQMLNVLQVAAFLGVIATGQTLAMLAGGIDLSQAGVVTLVNIVAADLMAGQSARVPGALAVCFALSALVGVANGVLVSILRVTPLIATLGVNSVLFGAALVYTGGAPHGAIPASFQEVGAGSLSGVPAATIVWLGLAMAVAWLSRATVLGRLLYATGANPRAATLMGVRVSRTITLAYVGSSILAGAGGLLLTAYVGAPSLGIGVQFMLGSVAAVVIGGTALTGGVGGIVGTIGGTILVTELASFTNVIRVSSGMQYVVQGVVIAASVLAYRALAARRTQ